MVEDKICVIENAGGINEKTLNVNTIPFHNFWDVESEDW
jgi:hypothetical protein